MSNLSQTQKNVSLLVGLGGFYGAAQNSQESLDRLEAAGLDLTAERAALDIATLIILKKIGSASIERGILAEEAK